MFLIDTDVISSTFPESTRLRQVQAFVDRHWAESFLSVLTIGELWFGVERLGLSGASRRAARLGRWAEDVENTYAGRILQPDLAIVRLTGLLLARAEKAGHRPGFVDACVAATASRHRFTVVTFNTKHFAAFDVPHRPPFAGPEAP